MSLQRMAWSTPGQSLIVKFLNLANFHPNPLVSKPRKNWLKFSLGNLQRPQWFSTVPEVPRIWSAPKDHLEIKFILWKTSMVGDFRISWSWPNPSSQCNHLLECTLSEGQIREHTEQKWMYRNAAMGSKLPSTLYWYLASGQMMPFL